MQDDGINYYQYLYELELYGEKVTKSVSIGDLMILAMEIKGYIFNSEYLKQMFLKNVNNYGNNIKIDKNKKFVEDLINTYILPIFEYNKVSFEYRHQRQIFSMLHYPSIAKYVKIQTGIGSVGLINFYTAAVSYMYRTQAGTDKKTKLDQFIYEDALFYEKYKDLISSFDFYLFVMCGYHYKFENVRYRPRPHTNKIAPDDYSLNYTKSVIFGVINRLCSEIERKTRKSYDDSVNIELMNQGLKDAELYELAAFIKKHPNSKYTIDDIVNDYEGIFPNPENELTRDKLTKLIGQMVDILETEEGKARGISRLRELLKKHDFE